MSDHAKSNAASWLANIHEMLTNLGLAESGGDSEAADACRSDIAESPLSVQVRSGWYTPGEANISPAPCEYEILLSTGGPALRIVGELGDHNEPETANLQWQDWGTPWTDYEYPGSAAPAEAAVLSFARHFYFGDR